MNKINETLDALKRARERSSSILVGFSGGKDSLVITDLCLRVFDRVEGFFMYLVPGLRCCEEQLELGRQRWNLKIHQYPHWLIRRYLKEGMYCFNHYRHDDLPDWTLQHVFDLAAAQTGIPLVATGAKESDSANRRRLLRWSPKNGNTVYPIQTWHKHDVIGYLKAHNIPLPPSSGQRTTGVDLSTPELLWLHDHYKDDYEKVIKVFPLAAAIVFRRQWYGVDSDRWSKG